MRNFHIRKDVLRFYSGYFAAALDGRFMETEENMCRLPEEDPIIFEMFQHWIHTRTLYESPLEPAALLSYQVSIKISHRRHDTDHRIADCKAMDLRGRSDHPHASEHAIDAFARKPWLTGKPVTESCGLYILDNTVESSPLHRLLQAMIRHVIPGAVRFLAGQGFESAVRALPWTDERTSYHRWASFEVSSEDLCTFHVHEEENSCKGT